ncbi:protein SCO1/2 [Salegentibacter echinorum]|uniref:Protein SCO1/2 n=1 Tax=Salegentibacter echinorum TaxID=1073325 RepID=A0A1M5CFN7_SALEC|nr:SCO family protein [Salegentibacter echinorum]SHF53521.1 protein SCO1/2 [Salegentibacter echinorum]
MKLYKIVIVLVFFMGLSCKNDTEEKSVKQEQATLENQELPEMSIYNLPSTWTTQDGKDIELKELRGKVLVMVMIYTSCKASCPRLVADMREIQKKVPAEKNEDVKYVFVSIDPEVDSPERLKAFAKENQMDSNQWLFLRGSKENTQEFAAVLAFNYKRISPMDFSHSNIISVFDKEGVLAHQKEGLGEDDSQVIKTINELAD